MSIDKPSHEGTKTLHLFRINDSEKFWIAAHSQADAVSIYNKTYGVPEDETIILKITRVPDDESVTVNADGTKTIKTAAQWAAKGRGVVAATLKRLA